MIEVETPDGGIAEFPDGTAPDVIKNTLRKKFPAPASSPSPDGGATWGDTAIDAAKGLGTGLVHGVTGLLGSIGDAKQMAGDLVGWGADKLGASPDVRNAAVKAGEFLTFPGLSSAGTSEQLNNAVESVAGKLPEAQTVPGRIAERIGEFAPAAVGGPGTLARKAVMTVVPATASVLSGEIPGIKGSAAQPYVETFTGLATGLPLAGGGKVNALKEMRDAAPSIEEVATQKTAAYSALDKAGIVFDQNAVKTAAMKAKSDLAKLGWTAAAGGETGQMVNRINDLLKPRKVAGWTTIDKLLSDAKAILRSNADDTTKNNIRVIVGHFEDMVKNGKVISRTGLPRAEMNASIDNARELARRHIIAKQIEDMRAKLPGYAAGAESGWRNQFGSYFKTGKAKGLADAERNAFAKVVSREGWLNAAHNEGSRLGNIATNAAAMGLGGMLGSALGPIGTVVGAAAGKVANSATSAGFRKLMDKITEKAVDDALKTVLAGKQAQGEALTKDAKEQLRAQIRAVLAAESATVPARNDWFLQDANGTTYSVPR